MVSTYFTNKFRFIFSLILNMIYSLRQLLCSCKVFHKWIPNGSRVEKNTHPQNCKCEVFCQRTRLGGKICLSDVIIHKGHYKLKGVFTDLTSIYASLLEPGAHELLIRTKGSVYIRKKVHIAQHGLVNTPTYVYGLRFIVLEYHYGHDCTL